MVKALHAAGVEVILDVVYNHTCEGNEFGPTLSFRGIDNATYYRLAPRRDRYYVDYTGTGNTLNVRHPQVLKLVMDSLRYWVTEMHVDGFRFDLASALARQLHEVDKLAPFFDVIHQDPILSQVKLIAEPWDIGDGGYQVGNFPVLWSEWNGKFRDSVRRFWRGDESYTSDLASRLSGSSDLYGNDGRTPMASINFVTAHDGFTLRDLVSHNQKHNQANREGNRDGTNENYSWNYGVEGDSDDSNVVANRNRQQRNLLATLLLSQGVPMLSGGDEINRSQLGNNNAYCQDNEVSWLDWRLSKDDLDLFEFTRELIRLRMKHYSLRRTRFFTGKTIGKGLKDILWLRTDGKEMSDVDWATPWVRSIGALMPASGLTDIDAAGQPLSDDTLLIFLNSDRDAMTVTLPDVGGVCEWEMMIDTNRFPAICDCVIVHTTRKLELAGRSVVLLRADQE